MRCGVQRRTSAGMAGCMMATPAAITWSWRRARRRQDGAAQRAADRGEQQADQQRPHRRRAARSGASRAGRRARTSPPAGRRGCRRRSPTGQVVVDRRDDRRHRQDGQPQGIAGEPQQQEMQKKGRHAIRPSRQSDEGVWRERSGRRLRRHLLEHAALGLHGEQHGDERGEQRDQAERQEHRSAVPRRP